MKKISLFIPLLGTLLLSGCAGTNTEFECNATTSDTCMTMEQANEKAKKLEQSSEAKPVAASLPRLAEGNFRTMPVQTVTATTPSGSRPAVTAHPEQKLLAPRPLFTAAREVKTVVPVSSVTPVCFFIFFFTLLPESLMVLSRQSLIQLMRLTEDVPDARQELLNRLLSGKKLTGRDEKDIRRLWQEKVDAMQESATRQREQDTIRKFAEESKSE